MDTKLDNITRLLKKTSAEDLGTYVITRLWHLLNDNDLKLVPKQYVNHSKNEYVLTDLYHNSVNSNMCSPKCTGHSRIDFLLTLSL